MKEERPREHAGPPVASLATRHRLPSDSLLGSRSTNGSAVGTPCTDMQPLRQGALARATRGPHLMAVGTRHDN